MNRFRGFKHFLVSLFVIVLTASNYLNNKQARYEQWKQCLDNSDRSDSECEECDRLFDKQKEFIYE